MKSFCFFIIMGWISCGYAQNMTTYYDDRDSNGTGLVLYSNGLFECDNRYEFLKTGKDPLLYLSRGVWHPLDSNLIELKSFEEYKSQILNVITYNNPEIGDSIKIQVFNKEGVRIGYAFLDGQYNGMSYKCSVEEIYKKEINSLSYYKTKYIINLPYELTFDLTGSHNQYYFIVSSFPEEGYYSYHDCIIEVNIEKKQFRIVKNRESIYRRTKE